MNKAVKVVFVDWNGTLSSSKFFSHLEKENTNLFSKIQNTLFNNGQLGHLLDPWMRGNFNTEVVINHLSKQLDYSYKSLLKEFVKSCENMVIDQEILNLVSEIRNKNVKVVIATDNMDSFNRWTIPRLKLDKHFDYILNSYHLKARKKDFDKQGENLFFGKYLQENNINPQETILIDDSEDKEGKIAKYGIQYNQLHKDKKLVEVLELLLTV